jgi:Protein of unknown function (DUF1700).
MNRIDFISQLKCLLSDISEGDRNDALEYYNNYFDEAGAENEGQVIRELGSPGKVAAMIRASLRSNEGGGEYTETGYQEADAGANKQPLAERYSSQQPRRGGGKLVLIVILAIFASPFIIGMGGGLFGLIIGLFAGLVGLIIGLLGIFLGGFVAGVVGIVTGVIEMFTSPATGLLMVGSGMVSLAVALAMLCLAIWLGFRIVPKIFRGITGLISRVIHRNKGGELHE